ncbi:MAG TPA: zinc ribbon domain-containing protein [Pyrinomonadaceae bacterium]|nr:zinc ribbon domain-containing protein [Pyrinomonadaceae bacterium]
MSEFIPVMDMSGNGYTVAEHSTRRVLAGDVESVRRRLVYALESLGYTVVSENPLQARRGRQKDIVRSDFTDHARKLAVGLRQGGAAATQVTFEFAVTHGGCSTKGDLLTLEREADAILALAAEPHAAGLCRACGTENGADARFCRLCGAPNVAGAPAELEVLRLTAGARAGLQEVVGGLFLMLLTAACMLPLIIFSVNPKPVRTGWIFLAIGEFFGWLMTLYGVLRLYRTLNRKPEPLPSVGAPVTQALPHAQTSALPPAHFSVTEGTTELLGANPREREPVPARREKSDTSPIG